MAIQVNKQYLREILPQRLFVLMSKIEKLDYDDPEFIRAVLIFDRLKSNLIKEFGDITQLSCFFLITRIEAIIKKKAYRINL